MRPLDYEYLTSLSPGAQRFYELLSFQMYGAIAGGRPRAKMRYSDYCKYAPQIRYLDFDHVKKQMFKIHAPHREAGYIAKVDYEQAVDGEGAPDWEMLYTPGTRAIAEFEAFTRRQVHRSGEGVALPPPGAGEARDSNRPDIVTASPLLAELTRRGVAERKGRELLDRTQPGQEVLDQLEYVDSLVAKATKGRITNPPGLYVMYVRDNVAPPENFLSSRKRASSRKPNNKSAMLPLAMRSFELITKRSAPPRRDASSNARFPQRNIARSSRPIAAKIVRC